MKERQLEIIAATGRILTSSGVKGLTIKNLAKEMNFSESAIYRHFANKESIIISMLNYLADIMDEHLCNSILTDDNPEVQLLNLFKSQFNFFSKQPHFVVAVFSDGLMEESKNINEAILNIMNIKMKHLKPIIKKGQQTGVFTNQVSTEILLHIVMGTFRLQMYKWRLANFQFDIKRSGNSLTKSLLKLIKQKK